MDEKIRRIYNVDSRKLYNKTEFNRDLVGNPSYGETGFFSIETLVLNFIEYFNENTVFYDLGCGTGKIVYHIGLKYHPKKSCGIEYSKERCILAEEIKEKFEIDSKNIEIINANILDCDISDATVIYIDNTLFPVGIDNAIYELIPDGCLVITRKPLKREILYKKDLMDKIFTEYGTGSLYYFTK